MVNRTSSGINNADLFHKNEYLVYVEGKYDINFWSIFFPDEISGYKRNIKQVGGNGAIEKYLESLIKHNGQFAVALDSDYKSLSKISHNHPQVIETVRHSIENVMIMPKILAKIIRVSSHQEYSEINNVEMWFDHFDRSMYDLMIADYVIQNTNIGKPCLGDNCSRFLENQKTRSPIFDLEKINEYIDNLELQSDIFNHNKKTLNQYKPTDHIQGHFLFSAALCFVNHEINRLRNCKKNTHISNDNLYSMLFLACESLLSDLAELQLMRQKAMQVAKEVVKILSE
jgi:Protein of unknown function (DUF4435)